MPTNTICEVKTRLIDVLEEQVDEKYYLSEEKTRKLTLDSDLGGKLNQYEFAERNREIAIKEATKKGYTTANVGDSVNVSYPNSTTRRGRVGKQLAQTLQAGEVNQGVVTENIRIRKLTPLECWRLQGFSDDQFYKAKSSGVSNSQLYKQAGNAVTVNVVEVIVNEL